MFERYQMGANGLVDRIARAYELARTAFQRLDQEGAFRIDEVRRRLRLVERVGRLDRSITETMTALSELEDDIGGAAGETLRQSRAQLQWTLMNLRK